jgi:dipeptidyl aminopeptidase/acylaminoacyl peptidase
VASGADSTDGAEAPSAASAEPDPATTAESEDPATSSAPARPTAPPPDPVSLPALAERGFSGGNLRLRSVKARTDAYTQHYVTYRSNGLQISGILNVPDGPGPHPALVLAHGYIDPAVYVNGQGLMREQDWLARAGYVVLHTDYRNHAGSSPDPAAERRLRLGYTADVVNAVKALRKTDDVPVDDERIGLLGRSMGGGVVYNVLAVAPGLVDAATVFAPVSSSAADNFNRWTRADPGRSDTADHILREYGEPRENRRFWSQVSPRRYFDQITEPVLIHHGTADSTCPPRWSRETARLMREAGVDVRLREYAGEEHAFIALWPQSMRRTTAFFDANLGA